MDIGRLRAIITADDRDFRRKMQGADRVGAQTASRIQSKFSSLKLNIPDVGKSLLDGASSIVSGNLISGAIETALGGIGGAMKNGLSAGIEYNKMLENATVRFTRFFASASEVDRFRDGIAKFAKDSPIFELPEALTGAQRLLQMRFAAEKIPGMLAAIGDAVGGVGGNVETIDKVTLAFAQMVSSGKIQAEEMEQLVEANIPAWELLAKAIGKTEAETRNLVSAGRVQGRGGVEGIVAMMGETFAGQSERAGKTLSGLESQFKSGLEEQLGKATKGSFEELKKGYIKAAEGLSTTGAQVFATEIDKLLTEQARKMQSVLDRVASGELFKQGAEATQFAGDAINAAETAAGGIGKLFPKDHLLNQKTSPKDFNIFRPDQMKDPLDRAVFGGIRDVLQWLGVVGGEDGKKAGQQIGAGLTTGTKQELEMKSPSKVFERIGLGAMEGLSDGLEAGKKKIPVSLSDLAARFGSEAEKIAKAMEDALGKVGAEKLLKKGVAFGPGFFTSGRADIDAQIQAQAARQSLPPELLFAQLLRESRFNPNARSGAGAEGIAQFMPGTAKRFKLKNPFDPIDSIRAQADYMGALFDKFEKFGNVEDLALAGYNAGENRKTLAAGRVPNITETREYIKEISAVTDAIRQAVPATQSLSVGIQSMANMAAQALPTIQAWSQSLPNMLRGAIPGNPGPASISAAMNPAPLDLAKSPVLDKGAMVAAGMAQMLARLREMPVALRAAGDSLGALGSRAGQWAQYVDGLASKFGTAAERFGEFKDRLGANFDDLIGSLIEGGDRWKDAARNIATDLFNTLASEMMLAATGGKHASLGSLIGGSISNMFKGFFGDKSAANGGFRTPDFNPNAGSEAGNPVVNGLKKVAEKVMDGAGVVKDTVKETGAKSFEQLSKLATSNAAMAACGCPADIAPTAGRSGVGSIIGSIIGAVGAGFAGGGSGGGGGELTGISFEEFAAGGPVRAGILGKWNEPGNKGELFVPSGDGYILNREQAAAAVGDAVRGGGRGAAPVYNITINVPIHAPAGSISPATRQQTAAEMARALQFALGRNG